MGFGKREASRNEHEKVHIPSHGDHGAIGPPRHPAIKRRNRLDDEEENQQNSEPLKCPRCDSKNTKFCYYNNYNKSQPRHFCKACKRHWTSGGILRNVPVGGDRKKKKRRTSDTVVTSTTTTTVANSSTEVANTCDNESNNLLSTDLGETLRNAMNKNGENENIVASSALSPFHYQDLQVLHAGFGFGLLEANQCPMIPNTIQSSSIFSSLVGEADTLEHLDHTSMCSISWNVVDVPSEWDLEDICEVSASELIIPWDDTRLIP
ncbi:hypothetical protein Droror1_Dr00020838 [Drosera rotundifolia]